MCRFVAYYGPPISMADLITRPVNSLIHQSFESRERAEPLNGDGFGVCWYESDMDERPGLFRSISPAWSNRNLHEIARMTVSPCILGHVRAASEGMWVTEPNCHPFVHGRHAFMHNGEIGGFRTIQRRLLDRLSDPVFRAIEGTTDSEHLFALFLEHLGDQQEADPVLAMAGALRQAVTECVRMAAEHAPGQESVLNLAVSDGRGLVACRYATRPQDAPSLHVHAGHRYACEGGLCRMVDSGDAPGAVIVSSEVLSDDPGWEAVPLQHMLVVSGHDRVELHPLEPRASQPPDAGH